MDDSLVAELDALEDALARAQVAHDVDTLDRLLHDDLVYTDPGGGSGGKQDDLEAHRTSAFTLDRFDVAHRSYDLLAPGVVLARVRIDVESDLGSGLMHYTRVWVRGTDDAWRIRAAHLHMTPNP